MPKEEPELQHMPMMPIRDVVIFPYTMTPFVVGRRSSLRALEAAIAGDRKLLLATQHDATIDEPAADQIYRVGTIVNIVQSLKLPDGHIKVLVEGAERAHVMSVSTEEGFFRATVSAPRHTAGPGPDVDALIARITSLFEQYIRLNRNLNYETMLAAIRMDDPGKLSDTVGANLPLALEEKQELLEIFDPMDRLRRIAGMLEQRCDVPGTAIHQEVILPALPERVYEALLDAAEFGAFTNMRAEIQPRAGEAFRLFGGLVEGRNVELLPGRRIVQAWRRASWAAGVYSMVRIELTAHDSGTRLVLDHTGIAEEKWQELKAGWHANYWEPLRRRLAAQR